MKNMRTALFFSFGFGFALATAWVTPPLQAQVAPPQPASNIVVQHDVPMKTRDGLTLYADIYRPNSASKLPVILCARLTTRVSAGRLVPFTKWCRAGTLSLFRMSAAATLRKVNGIRLGTSKPTAMTPLNGLPHARFAMAKSG